MIQFLTEYMSIEFMERMISTYERVHNKVYWKEITPILDSLKNKNSKIMDLGCGPGLLLKNLSERLNPLEIIGVDISDVMLNRVKEEFTSFLKSSPQSKLRLINQHLQENPELPKNIDLIVSSRVLRSFEDQKQIMHSIYRSLNPGGYFIVLDWTRESISMYAKWFEQQSTDFENLDPWQIILYHRNFSRYGLEDWKYILKSARFEIMKQFQIDAVHGCSIARKPS